MNVAMIYKIELNEDERKALLRRANFGSSSGSDRYTSEEDQKELIEHVEDLLTFAYKAGREDRRRLEDASNTDTNR